MNPEEAALRRKLDIPEDARQVLVFGESSHWDPNWLLTSEEYYLRRIRSIFDAIFVELEKQPRRVFSIEGLFFLRLFWEREPSRRGLLRRLLDQGRIRLIGAGITTPDTVLPDTEAILRDYQLGQQWLRDQGLEIEPTLAYLPDDFGYSPATPGLLRALGYRQVGITRIDGMYFVAADYRPRKAFPLPGSSAELLYRQHKTLDFVWRAPDGSEVLCHWNAFNYFQGEMLAHIGVIRWMGLVCGFPWRTRSHIAKRIEGFADRLGKLALTPYLFCPIGCDFNEPIRDLVELLDDYNRHRYPDRGLHVVNAGLDDYLALIDCHRDRLPMMELDPNPYWMGFYASRPEAKYLHNRAVRKLVQAEKLSTVSACADPGWKTDLDRAWDMLAVGNHHDFITGTSPDRVWASEQRPWLEQSGDLADRVLELHRSGCAQVPKSPAARPPAWRLADGRLEVVSRHYRLTLSERAGGCMTSLRPGPDGAELLEGPGNDLVTYRDAGGLWRLGHEFKGGYFEEASKISRSFAAIQAREENGLLTVRIESRLDFRLFVRTIWLRDDSPVIRMRISGSAANRRSVACRFPTRIRARIISMDVPGGFVDRPLEKLYRPTFWPARSFAHVVDPDQGQGLGAILGGPACIRFDAQGVMEGLVLRNAPREKAFRVLPILAHPASGSDPDEHVFDYAIVATPEGDWRENRLFSMAAEVLDDAWLLPGTPDSRALAESLVTVDDDLVRVSAVKIADFGSGRIVRLLSARAGSGQVRLRCRMPVSRAMLCDARERDLRPLEVVDRTVVVPVTGSITSVRIVGGHPDRNGLQ